MVLPRRKRVTERAMPIPRLAQVDPYKAEPATIPPPRLESGIPQLAASGLFENLEPYAKGANGINLEDERLSEHLFGADRVPFPKVLREGLADLQNGACFYCGNGLADRPQVDHFIPWSRWPNNAIENLVLADGCNGLKSDYLPAFRHVDGWAHRFVAQAADLASVAGNALWESDPHRTLGLTRSCFAHVPVGTPLWVQADEFAEDDPTLISARLADLPSR